MDVQLAVIFALTFLIHLIGTLAYAARIAGTRTDRIAVSFALFNILILISRTSNSFQIKILLFNIIAMAIWTVGVFAPLYAGYLNPELRLTSSNLSAIVNGVATILMFIFIDPYLSVLTDDVVEGKMSDSAFRRVIVWLVGSRLAGTIVAQIILLPATVLIVKVAELL